MTEEQKNILKQVFKETIIDFIKGNWGYDPDFEQGFYDRIWAYWPNYSENEKMLNEIDIELSKLIEDFCHQP